MENCDMTNKEFKVMFKEVQRTRRKQRNTVQLNQENNAQTK